MNQMVMVEGGKLTQREIDDFLGAASCASVLFGGALAIFGAMSCINWLT